MFLSDLDTLSDLAAALKVTGEGALPDWWTALNVRSHAWAYQQIVSILASRGYTASQIAQIDQGEDLESDLTLFRNLVRGGATEALTKELLEELDRRAELRGDPAKGIAPLCPTIGGAFAQPAGTAGQAVFGEADVSSDTFVWPPREGEPFPPGDFGKDTRW